MVNTNMHVFKHPKFYEEYRKRAKRYQKELRERNKSDQAISKRTCDGESERASDPGHMLPDSKMVKQRASSSTSRGQEHQAPSVKPQAPEASSGKRQAPSSKRQA